MDQYSHKSVFLDEVLEFLKVKKGGWYLDCTLGDGGHSLEILKRGGRVVGLDVDPEALSRTKQRFEEEGINSDQYQLKQGNFRNLKELVGERKFEGVVFDFGVSTLQLKNPSKGFSLFGGGELDMRMDPTLGVRAQDLLNILNQNELSKIFQDFGEEPQAKRISKAVVLSRPLTSAKQLADLVEKVVGGKQGYTHPATKVFQALRIVVNGELEVIEESLPQALEVLDSEGMLVVISFHSLEDRIVKKMFKNFEINGQGKSLLDKPMKPTDQEINENIRSRSAILRVFEKN